MKFISTIAVLALIAAPTFASSGRGEIDEVVTTNRELHKKDSSSGKDSKNSKSGETCFVNDCFGAIVEALSSGNLLTDIAYRVSNQRRMLESEESRRLGGDSRGPCMSVGGFPVYFMDTGNGAGQSYLGCVPACEIDLDLDCFEDSCFSVKGGKECGYLKGFEGFVIGVGTNDDFFAYCCPNEGLDGFVNVVTEE